MAPRFLAPDLTQLAPAALIEEISFENILAAQRAWVLARWDQVRIARPDLPPLDTLGLETEPMTVLLEAYAYRETLMRALVNDKARAVLLAYAVGTDLDHVGVLFGVQRMVMERDGAGAPTVMESDDRLRRRIQLAPEAFSVAGPRGAYIFHALTLDPTIADAYAFTPREGEVVVVVSGASGADVSDAVLARLDDRLAAEDTVPLTDAVSIRRARRVDYAVSLSLAIPRGPDPDIIKARAQAAVAAYAAGRCRINTSVHRSGLIAAATVGGVEDVALVSPVADVSPGLDEIANLTSITINTVISD